MENEKLNRTSGSYNQVSTNMTLCRCNEVKNCKNILEFEEALTVLKDVLEKKGKEEKFLRIRRQRSELHSSKTSDTKSCLQRS